MIYRSKAPLRIGLAGGGTDVSPYCDQYNGAILNATISLFAHANIELIDKPKIIIQGLDKEESEEYDWQNHLPINGTLDLLKGVYNRVQQDFPFTKKGLRISTFVDAPSGSGLGTSSTLVVAIVGAFVEMLQLPMGEYDIAHYAYEIERNDLKLAGGRQDQYAATFGGVNYMEFFRNDNVIVNPLRIRQEYLNELEHNLLLYYTSTSRESARIIEEQSKNVKDKNQQSIEAMHQLKHQSVLMKEALLKGKIDEIGNILDIGFEQKRLMAKGINNSLIDDLYTHAKMAGASGGKISGAGGGGFMIFYCPSNSKHAVKKQLEQFGGIAQPYQFTKSGLETWTI